MQETVKADLQKFRNFPNLHNLAQRNFDLLDFNFTQANPITAQVKMLPALYKSSLTREHSMRVCRLRQKSIAKSLGGWWPAIIPSSGRETAFR